MATTKLPQFNAEAIARVQRENEARRLMWAIEDRLRARASGEGVFAEIGPENFKRTINILLDEFEEVLK